MSENPYLGPEKNNTYTCMYINCRFPTEGKEQNLYQLTISKNTISNVECIVINAEYIL